MSKNVAAIEGKIETKAESQGELNRLEKVFLHGSVRWVLTCEVVSPSPTRSLPSEDGNTISVDQRCCKAPIFLNRSQISLQGSDMSHVLLSDMQVSILLLSLNIFILLPFVERQS